MKKNKFKKQILRNIYAFIVDGETEKWYLKMILKNNKNVKVNFSPEIGGHGVKEDIKRISDLSKLSYEKVFWIVDMDVIIKESYEFKGKGKNPIALLKEACKKYKNSKTVFIIKNNPCFEYWFLLHFVSTTKYFSNYKELERELKKNELLKNYKKKPKFYTNENCDIYIKLNTKLNDALQNSKLLLSSIDDEFNFDRAMCEMPSLFKELGLCEDDYVLKK